MSSPPLPNPNVPQVPQPLADVGSLAHAARGFKQGLDSLAGFRGKPTDRAVTFNDLVAYGLLTASQPSLPNNPTTVSIPPGVVTPYVLSGFSGPDPLPGSQVIFGHRFPVIVSFPANFGPISLTMFSSVGSFVNATSAPTLSIQRCPAASNPTVGTSWTTIGTAQFGAGFHHNAALATTGGNPIVFQANDFMRIIAPAAPDPTLAQVHTTLVGKR